MHCCGRSRGFIRRSMNSEKYAVAQIKERLKVELPEDEAGFIALHFVNAEYGTNIRDALRFPNQMKEIRDRDEGAWYQVG